MQEFEKWYMQRQEAINMATAAVNGTSRNASGTSRSIPENTITKQSYSNITTTYSHPNTHTNEPSNGIPPVRDIVDSHIDTGTMQPPIMTGDPAADAELRRFYSALHGQRGR